MAAIARAAHEPGSGYEEWRRKLWEYRNKPGVGPCERCGAEGPLFKIKHRGLKLCQPCVEKEQAK